MRSEPLSSSKHLGTPHASGPPIWCARPAMAEAIHSGASLGAWDTMPPGTPCRLGYHAARIAEFNSAKFVSPVPMPMWQGRTARRPRRHDQDADRVGPLVRAVVALGEHEAVGLAIPVPPRVTRGTFQRTTTAERRSSDSSGLAVHRLGPQRRRCEEHVFTSQRRQLSLHGRRSPTPRAHWRPPILLRLGRPCAAAGGG